MRRRSAVGRNQRPSLVGTAARTAVIAGTATAVSGKVAAGQQQKMMAAQQQAVAAQAPEQEVAGGLTSAAIEQLKQLGELRDAGILTDEEFEAKKASILG